MVNEELDKFQDNWVVLNMQNPLDSVDEIPILDPNQDYSKTTYTSSSFIFPVYILASWQISYRLLSDSNTFGWVSPAGNYPTIESLVIMLNAQGIWQEPAGGDGIWSYTTNSDGTVTLIAKSITRALVQIVQPTLPTEADFTSSGIFTSESPLSMTEITQELVYQPYKIDTIDVFASNVAQANQQFSVGTRSPNGTSYRDVKNPAVNPIQPQSALIDVKLGFEPSPTNVLLYKMNPLESVRLILKYSHIGLDEVSKMTVRDIKGFEDVELPVAQPLLIKDDSIRGVVLNQIKMEQLKRLGVDHLDENNIKRLVAGYL
jgi:hypothetical protein